MLLYVVMMAVKSFRFQKLVSEHNYAEMTETVLSIYLI